MYKSRTALLVIRDATPAQQSSFRLMEVLMTHGKQAKSKPSSPDTGSSTKSGSNYRRFEFISPYLDKNDKQWLHDNVDNVGSAISLMVEQFNSKHTLSLKRDESSKRWVAILFDHSGAESAPGVALSVRGKNPIAALYALAYLHVYKLSDGWAVPPTDDDEDPWG